MRADGRTADQMRPLKITPDYISTAEGSVLIELGKTRVICTASVDDGVPHFMKGSGKGWVTSEYGMLPRATEERTPREATKGRQSGRTLEIQRLIGRSLRAVTDQEAMGDRTVWVDCDVIEADGGTRTASITGAFVALALAFERLVAAGILKRSPLIDSVAATSVGIVDDRALLDLAYEEDSRAEVDMNVVMTGSGHFVEIQATAEGRAFTGSEMQDLLALAAAGIRPLSCTWHHRILENLGNIACSRVRLCRRFALNWKCRRGSMNCPPLRRTLRLLRKTRRERRCIIRGFGTGWCLRMTRGWWCRRLVARPGYTPQDMRGRKRRTRSASRNS